MKPPPFEELKLSGELSTSPVMRRLYATDASEYQELPSAVAFPETEEDVRQIILFAGRYGIGIVPRTAGTSLAGQVVGNGLVVDLSRHFNAIRGNRPRRPPRARATGRGAQRPKS